MRVFPLLALASLATALPSLPPVRRGDKPVNSFDLSKCPGYTASNIADDGRSLTADLKLSGEKCNAYADDLEDLKLEVEYQANDRLHVKIYDAGRNMYQVQESVLPRPKNGKVSNSAAALKFSMISSPFSFKITRQENGEVLFDSSGVPLVFESQYVRLRTKLPKNPNLYGLGEHSDSFRLDTKDYTRSFWNAESIVIPQKSNLYGSHPVYFDHRGDRGTHGVFLLNANGMNINIDSDDKGQYLEYNTIGGVLDLYFLAGKSPAEVSKQYADVVGYSAMYPYWSLGFHQCRYGYWDVNMVAEVVANYSKAEIPLEVMWTDIDYMNRRRDFTLDPERFPLKKMRELVSTLHKRDQRYVLILDPTIPSFLADDKYGPYKRGKDLDIFLHDEKSSEPYMGVQWAGKVAWPDWFHPKTEQWWSNEIKAVFNPETAVDIDGMWVDMNEGANFCADYGCDVDKTAVGNPPEPEHKARPNTGRPIAGFPASFQPGSKKLKARKVNAECPRKAEFNTMKGTIKRNVLIPKYKINNHVHSGSLSSGTIYTTITNCDGTQQYDTHNLYGNMMAHTTHTSMVKRRPTKRPFVLTRSTFAGTGRKVAHWFGDNASTWEHYRTSIRQMLAFVSMHQMPMVGSDVCGFNGKADVEMCARWAMLGAFQPFYRNHAEISTPQQEFYIWPEVTKAAKKAIDVRYKLLDYAYTAMYYQTKEGRPMINPLFFLYPNDPKTFGIENQWFYGDALLIAPVVNDYSDTVKFYVPKGRFYNYWSYERVESGGEDITLSNVKLDEIPVYIRGGTIIPQRSKSAMTTTALRKQPLKLIVAPDSNGKAKGRLYLDDGESIEQSGISEINFTFENGRFALSGTYGYQGADGKGVQLEGVVVLGQKDKAGKNAVLYADGPGALKADWSFSL